MCAIVLQILIRASCMQRGAYIFKNGLLRKICKKLVAPKNMQKIGCSSMLTFPKEGKVDGAGQGGRDFYYKPFFSLFFLFSPIAQDKPVLYVACLSLMSKLFQSYAINQFTGFTFLH